MVMREKLQHFLHFFGRGSPLWRPFLDVDHKIKKSSWEWRWFWILYFFFQISLKNREVTCILGRSVRILKSIVTSRDAENRKTILESKKNNNPHWYTSVTDGMDILKKNAYLSWQKKKVLIFLKNRDFQRFQGLPKMGRTNGDPCDFGGLGSGRYSLSSWSTNFQFYYSMIGIRYFFKAWSALQ